MATLAVPTLEGVESPPKLGGILAVATVIDAADNRFVMNPDVVEHQCNIPQQAPNFCFDNLGQTIDPDKEFEGIDNTTDIVFGLYAGIECWLNGNDDFEQRARDTLTRGETSAIEQRVQNLFPVAGAGDPVAPNIVDAVAWAEQRASVYNGTPTILMNRMLATQAIAEHAVFPGLDWSLTTGQGSPVANGAFDSADTIWWSGHITVWRGPIQVSQAPAVTTNRDRVLAERMYRVHFECGIQPIKITPVP